MGWRPGKAVSFLPSPTKVAACKKLLGQASLQGFGPTEAVQVPRSGVMVHTCLDTLDFKSKAAHGADLTQPSHGAYIGDVRVKWIGCGFIFGVSVEVNLIMCNEPGHCKLFGSASVNARWRLIQL